MNVISKSNSPFFVISDFVSPQTCDDFVDDLDFIYPNEDSESRPLVTTKYNDDLEEMLYQRFLHVVPLFQTHYDVTYKGMERVTFEWVTSGAHISPRCENSVYTQNVWVRNKSNDFTGVVFLTDSYTSNEAFDPDNEVYGGKLEFPQHNFGFNPQKGTLVVFPSDPHFINATALAQAGDLYQARFHVSTNTPYFYKPSMFNGSYHSWFNT